MRLTVTTPLAVVLDAEDIAHVRAEDQSGAFGILPGHADFLTALAVSVVTWRDGKGVEHYLAVRGGMFAVEKGKSITIATREAVAGDDLPRLEAEVLAVFRRRAEEERTARTDAQRLYLAAVRQICRFLRSERSPAIPGGLGLPPQDGFGA